MTYETRISAAKARPKTSNVLPRTLISLACLFRAPDIRHALPWQRVQ
jgi:hypothetical protein